MTLLIILSVVLVGIPLYFGIGFVLMCYYNAVDGWSAYEFDFADFLLSLTWPITLLWWLLWGFIKKFPKDAKFKLVTYFRRKLKGDEKDE